MENILSIWTKPVYACIKKYGKYSFNYQGWTISDNYVLNESSPRHSQYYICITSPIITNQDELNDYSLQGQRIADMITELIPISGLPSLNLPKFKCFYNNQEYIDFKSAPDGWSSNYTSIQSMLNRERNNKISLDVTFEGFVRLSMLELSPLPDIQHMLEHYNDIEDCIKFLIFLNISIISANDINVFMLIGKAVEIINALYPYKKHQKSKDKRIEKMFPDLLDVFQDVTIEKLWEWSNYRKETRHYIDNKNDNLPHNSLKEDERKKLFRCSTSLIINVVRQAFKMPHKSIVFE